MTILKYFIETLILRRGSRVNFEWGSNGVYFEYFCLKFVCYPSPPPSLNNIFWVQLHQWGDAIDVWGDREAKRLGTPGLEYYYL